MLSGKIPSRTKVLFFAVFFSLQQSFTTQRPSSLTRRRCVRLPPIAQYSPLLPPVGVWTCLSSSVTDHPLRPVTRRCLGGLLPRQLADGTQTQPPVIAEATFPDSSIEPTYAVLASVSRCYPPPEDWSSTCYSPVRHYTHPKGLSRSTCMC